MLTGVIVDNQSESLANQLQSLKQSGIFAEIAVASTRARVPELDLEGFLWVQASSIAEALGTISEQMATKRLMFMRAELITDLKAVESFLINVESAPSTCFVLTGDDQLDQADFSHLQPEHIFENISRFDVWPIAAAICSRSVLAETSLYADFTAAEYIALTVMRSLVHEEALIQIQSSTPLSVEKAFSDDARAELLKSALDAFNIEELFPTLAWGNHSKESAAYAYHSLAALFISFGHLDSANQCLNLSERLEDSPRYFALKGVIAEGKGESLGAVANMVSSLQCYESRKHNEGDHFVTFKPLNVEVINTALVEGLNALQKSDNREAYEHFLTAVRNFDPFYEELGLSRAVGRLTN